MRKLAVAGLMTLSLLMPLGVSAAFSAGESGLSQTAGSAYGDDYVSQRSNVGEFVGTYVIKPVLSLLGLLFLVLTIYAGGLWMTAMGNEKRVQKAKDIVTAAVIGAVIIIAAYSVTNFLFDALTGASTTPTTSGTPAP